MERMLRGDYFTDTPSRNSDFLQQSDEVRSSRALGVGGLKTWDLQVLAGTPYCRWGVISASLSRHWLARGIWKAK